MQLYEVDGTKGYGFGSNSGIATPGLKAGATANPDAHWDTTNKYNLGLDLQFLRNRLTATMDFYYDQNSDILNQNIGSIIGTPIIAGGAISEKNFGTIDAWGSEFSLNWRDQVGKVNYNVGVNFGFSGNKVKNGRNFLLICRPRIPLLQVVRLICLNGDLMFGEVQAPEMGFYVISKILIITGVI